MYPELSEAERFPLLTPAGRQFLHAMRQHAHAPLWNWPNGEQLDEAGLERVQAFARNLLQANHPETLAEPVWLHAFQEYCLREVPFYRSRAFPDLPFEDLPTCCRADLAPRPWLFVPDDQPLESLIVFSSSGTTGYPTRTPHHPYSAACGIPLLEKALRDLYGIEFCRGPEQVALANVAAYPGAYTTAIVVAYLREAGCIRINLDSSGWRGPADIERYLNSWPAPIWLGDPIAFGQLEKVELKYAPQALISSIMHLHEGYAQHLSQRYGCPVLDVYALTEAGIVSVSSPAGQRVLADDLFIEILDERGQRCPPGILGEITLSGGRNPFLPLLRYRTGDYAALQLIGGRRVLTELQGRQPIHYTADSGRVVHSMEVVRLMRNFPVRRYELLPQEVGYELKLDGDVDRTQVLRAVQELLGPGVRLHPS